MWIVYEHDNHNKTKTADKEMKIFHVSDSEYELQKEEAEKYAEKLREQRKKHNCKRYSYYTKYEDWYVWYNNQVDYDFQRKQINGC